MKTNFIITLALCTVLLSSCGTAERKRLEAKVDSLTVVNTENQTAMNTLQEVGVLLDSIDANRSILRTNMVEGTTEQNYTSRLKNISEYVDKAEAKIKSLEKSMKKSSKAYVATINRLKAELEDANRQLAVIREEGMQLRSENGRLISEISEKDTLLSQQLAYIKVKEFELAAKEAEAREMTEQHRMEKADLYFAQAVALETAADRTKFAPRKRRATRREAIELYKISLSLGKFEAQERITNLEKKV